MSEHGCGASDWSDQPTDFTIFWDHCLQRRRFTEFSQSSGRVSISSPPSPRLLPHSLTQVDEGNYPELLLTDQLHKEMVAKRAFLGFKEPAIDFPPTFKVRSGK